MTPSLPTSLLGLLLVGLVTSDPDPALTELANGNADFSARLFRAVARRTDENFLLATFTAFTGMAALLQAAGGGTREQLLHALSLKGADPQGIPAVFQGLLASLQNASLQGVAVFSDRGVQVNASFQQLLQDAFRGSLQRLDFSAPQDASDTINRWTQEHTGDNIQQLDTHLDTHTHLLLATTAYLQARFQPAFNASFTQDERFFVDRYHVVMVPMMLRGGKHFLLYDGGVRAGVLKLPMAGGAAMLVALPDDGVDVTAVEEEVTSQRIQSWITGLKKTKLEVQLPRFLLERSYSLRDVLQTLNITQVFQEDADLSGMGGAKGPLTQVYHKSMVSVDESTDDITTGGGVSSFSSPPPRLTINRPFIFIIYQQTSGCVLFMGRVIDPTRK